MKSILLFAFLILQLFFWGCNNSDQTTPAKSENDIDAARNFIQSALAGDYKKAKTYLLNDSLNQQYIDAFERNYNQRMSAEDKMGYREASINIHLVKPLNDSTTIVNYSNSFKNKNDSLKVVRISGQWLVDLKYSFYQQPDSFP
jgi:type IV secretory pathway component VirB8